MAKNIIVSQIGARHRYTIPKTFYENNILKALFTDSYRYTFLGKLSYLFIRLGIKKTIFKTPSNTPVIYQSIRQTNLKTII